MGDDVSLSRVSSSTAGGQGANPVLVKHELLNPATAGLVSNAVRYTCTTDNMRQPCVEVEWCSIAHFNCITAFTAPYYYL